MLLVALLLGCFFALGGWNVAGGGGALFEHSVAAFAELGLQLDGRVMPVVSYARPLLRELSGSYLERLWNARSSQGLGRRWGGRSVLNAEALLFGLILELELVAHIPLIRLDNAELRTLLELDDLERNDLFGNAQRVSLAELTPHISRLSLLYNSAVSTDETALADSSTAPFLDSPRFVDSFSADVITLYETLRRIYLLEANVAVIASAETGGMLVGSGDLRADAQAQQIFHEISTRVSELTNIAFALDSTRVEGSSAVHALAQQIFGEAATADSIYEYLYAEDARIAALIRELKRVQEETLVLQTSFATVRLLLERWYRYVFPFIAPLLLLALLMRCLPRRFGTYSWGLTVVAGIMLGASIIIRMLVSGGLAITSAHSSILLQAWLFMLPPVFYRRFRLSVGIYSFLLVLSASLLLLISFPTGDELSYLNTSSDSNIFLILHVLCSSIAYIFLSICSFFGHAQVLHYYVPTLTNRSLDGNLGNDNLGNNEYIKHRFFLKIALVFVLISLLGAVLWSQIAWGRFWSWEPKEAALLLLVLYVCLLLQCWFRVSEKLRALLSAFVSIPALLACFAGSILQRGIHAYAWDVQPFGFAAVVVLLEVFFIVFCVFKKHFSLKNWG